MKTNLFNSFMALAAVMLLSLSVSAQTQQFEVTNDSDCDVEVQMDVREGSTTCGSGSFCTLTSTVTVPANTAIAIQPVCGSNAYWAKAIFSYGGNTYSVDCSPNTTASGGLCNGQTLKYTWVNAFVATVDD